MFHDPEDPKSFIPPRPEDSLTWPQIGLWVLVIIALFFVAHYTRPS